MNQLFDKKYIKITILVLLLLILFMVALFVFPNKFTKQLNQQKQTKTEETPKSQTWQNVDKNTYVPLTKEEASKLGGNVAEPENVVKANANTDANILAFQKLLIENNEFKPSEFRLKQGDVFDVFVKAVGQDYDITQPDYGIELKIKKGEEKRLQFQVTAAGKFMFYCKSCGGPEKGPKGYIIVVPK